MTTVAWDGEYLAVDRQTTNGADTKGETTKLVVYEQDGVTCAFAGVGDAPDLHMVHRWLRDGARESNAPTVEETSGGLLVVRSPDKIEAFDLVVVAKDGRTLYVDRHRLEKKFTAIGSGHKFALGAMAAGVNAIRAVIIAAGFDTMTGEGVDAFNTTSGAVGRFRFTTSVESI